MPLTLQSQIVTHDIVTKNKQTPRSLVITASPPYFLTRDSLGVENRLWVIDLSQEESLLRVICKLDPPLPLTTRVEELLICKKHNLIIIAHTYDRYEDTSLRVYNLETGASIQGIKLSGHWCTLRRGCRLSSDLLISLTVASSTQRIITHHITPEGLEEKDSFPLDPDIKLRHLPTPNLICYFSDGDFVTILDSISDSGHIVFNYHSYGGIRQHEAKYPLQDPDRFNIQYMRDTVLSNQTKLTSVVTEENWNDTGFMRDVYTSTIYSMTLPDLSLAWKTTLPYKLCQITHHPHLGVFMLNNSENVNIDGLTIVFIEESSGKVLKEIDIPKGPVKSHISSWNDELVIIGRLGTILVRSLESVLKEGIPIAEDGELITQVIPIRPAPYNKKTRKLVAEESWEWVNNVFTVPKMAVLFPERDPDMYVIKWS